MYGIDIEDDDILTRRTWRWLSLRIQGLLDAPPTIAPDGTGVPSTRLGWALNPPKATK